MTFDGKIDASDEISSNWDRSRIAVTADYNQDGAGDIFIPTSETYDGSFGVMQLYDSTIQYEITGDYDNDIHVIKAFDVNEDGYEDAVYLDSNTLRAVDVQNQRLLTSITAHSSIQDFDIVNVNNNIYIAISNEHNIEGPRTTLFKWSGTSFIEQSLINISCQRLIFINADIDRGTELACYVDADQSLHLFDVSDSSFKEISQKKSRFHHYRHGY
ncbi:hypothetical protein QW180_06955 [Vibrio sinaloensis]|nr:hypothetical protein [Vibrio sinaloensis]